MNTATSPLLSIVIPTKDRPETLLVLVKHLLSWSIGADDYEIVVEDNSGNNDIFLSEIGQQLQDQRLRYNHSNDRRSAVANCDAAISRASGQVITFIGDDDGIVPSALIAAKWMVKEGVQALVVQASGYTWPDMQHAHAINYKLNGQYIEGPMAADLIRIDVKQELVKTMKCGAQSIQLMPRVYHSLVQKKTLMELRNLAGTFFPGPIPDMSNAVGLCSFANNVYHTSIPIIVSGQSRKSMSGRNSTRDHQGKLEDEPSLSADTNLMWDERIPKYWSAPTIWSSSALYAAKAVGQESRTTDFAFAKVYAACFAYNRRSYSPFIFSAIRANGRFAILRYALPVLVEFIRISASRAMVLLCKLRPKKSGQFFPDMNELLNSLESRLTKSGIVNKAFRRSAQDSTVE